MVSAAQAVAAQCFDLGGLSMTPGEKAYLEDVRRQPVYPFNGKPRALWSQLGDDIRANWERYPTPRKWGKAEA